MSKRTTASLVALVLMVAFLLVRQGAREPEKPPPPDLCITCHTPKDGISPSHSAEVVGCSVCHLGNPFARDEKRAHLGMVYNPGRLEHAKATCGREKCHRGIPERVEKSVMATNSGILEQLQKLWPHNQRESVESVAELMTQPVGKSLALDHFRKMCGGCHLHKKRDKEKGEIGRRGGGCTDCHIVELEVESQDLKKKEFLHPGLTTRIPDENCVKCHNRSARVALSYTGRFETEGYGTPYQGGDLNGRRLSGGRFYMELPPDVHFKDAKMGCIDCHTEKGLMGDGERHVHMAGQVDITCEACHLPGPAPGKVDEDLALRLARVNGRQPESPSGRMPVSPKGSPLYHMRVLEGGEIKLFLKEGERELSFEPLKREGPHGSAAHQRLKCQACHSRWTPQCYGCHDTLFMSQGQRDWLTGEGIRGRWVEGRSYLRFESPTLGVGPGGKIEPFAPGCQVFIEAFDREGNYLPSYSHRHLVMASFDPHTTAKEAPGCLRCHLDPKVLGLGEGSLALRPGGIVFEPFYMSRESGLDLDFPLDGFVSAKGEQLQRASREKSRGFNQEELLNITRVALCLPCHDDYSDTIWRDVGASLERFQAGKTPCYKELK